MKNKIIYYSLLQSICDRNKNILDFYSIFILKSLKISDEDCEEIKIHRELNYEFDFYIPLYSIRSIMTILLKKEFITYSKQSRRNRYSITEKGVQELKVIENIKKRKNKEMEMFYEKAKMYLEVYKIYIDEETFEESLSKFIYNNISHIDVFKNIFSKKVENVHYDNKFHFYFNKFISEIYENETELYDIFNDIVKGHMLSAFMNKENVKFSPVINDTLIIYLDTSIIISLLELHPKANNLAVKQMFELAKSYEQISFRVLSVTLEKLYHLLNTYKSVKEKYNIRYPVDDVFYFLKKRKYDNNDIDYFIKEIPAILQNMGIEIISLDLIKPNDLDKQGANLFKEIYEHYQKINLNKPIYHRKNESSMYFSVILDTSVILHIRSLRNDISSGFSDCRSFIVTSSYHKANFSYINNSKENNFPEVIHDQDLTNILWLNDPSSKIDFHIKDWLGFLDRNDFIDRVVWFKFYNNLKEMLETNEINQEKYIFILSNSQIVRNILVNCDPDEIDFEYINAIADYASMENEDKDKKISEMNNLIQIYRNRVKDTEILLNKFNKESKENKLALNSSNSEAKKFKKQIFFANHFFKISMLTVIIFPVLFVFGLIPFVSNEFYELIYSLGYYKIAVFALSCYFILLFFFGKLYKSEYRKNFKHLFKK